MKYFILEDPDKYKLVNSIPKEWVVREDYSTRYVQADSQGYYNSIVEALVSEMLRFVDRVKYTDYFLCKIKDGDKTYYGCYHEGFTDPCELAVSLEATLISNNIELNQIFRNTKSIEQIVELDKVLEKCTGYTEISNYLKSVLILDYLICNKDRDYGSLEIIRRLDTKEYSTPILSNFGKGLLSNIYKYPYSSSSNLHIKSIEEDMIPLEELLGYLDGFKLVLDYDSFMEKLSKCVVGFKVGAFLRAKEVLVSRLNMYEDVLWCRPHKE